MDDFARFAYALILITMFYAWWMNYVRLSDLVQTLKIANTEMLRDEYEVTLRYDEHGAEVIELSNPTTIIFLVTRDFSESIFVNLFFRYREDAGGNLAYISRYTVGGGNYRTVRWWRKNHLMGTLLYFMTSDVRRAHIHELFDELRLSIRLRAEKTQTKTPP